jgi:hypothetical protein
MMARLGTHGGKAFPHVVKANGDLCVTNSVDYRIGTPRPTRAYFGDAQNPPVY